MTMQWNGYANGIHSLCQCKVSSRSNEVMHSVLKNTFELHYHSVNRKVRQADEQTARPTAKEREYPWNWKSFKWERARERFEEPNSELAQSHEIWWCEVSDRVATNEFSAEDYFNFELHCYQSTRKVDCQTYITIPEEVSNESESFREPHSEPAQSWDMTMRRKSDTKVEGSRTVRALRTALL